MNSTTTVAVQEIIAHTTVTGVQSAEVATKATHCCLRVRSAGSRRILQY